MNSCVQFPIALGAIHSNFQCTGDSIWFQLISSVILNDLYWLWMNFDLIWNNFSDFLMILVESLQLICEKKSPSLYFCLVWNIFVDNWILQNGSIWDGLTLWKNNLDKRFSGVEECYICFSIVHATTNQIPKLSCHTCRKKFHTPCLVRWYLIWLIIFLIIIHICGDIQYS